MTDPRKPKPLAPESVARLKRYWENRSQFRLALARQTGEQNLYLRLIATIEEARATVERLEAEADIWEHTVNTAHEAINRLQAEVARLTADLAATTTLPDAEAIFEWVHWHRDRVGSIAYPTDHTYRTIIKGTLAAIADLREAAVLDAIRENDDAR